MTEAPRSGKRLKGGDYLFTKLVAGDWHLEQLVQAAGLVQSTCLVSGAYMNLLFATLVIGIWCKLLVWFSENIHI